MAKKLLPYVNRFTGEVKILTKSAGSKLNEDWARAKMAKNEKGEDVFRFNIAAPVVGKDGKTHMGVATIDISEVKPDEVADGIGKSE